jgi:UDPglucose 6-dehydrogenase
VPVGTADKVTEVIQAELESRGVKHNFTVISIPEFLKEGNAIADSMSPDRVVIGSPDKEVTEVIKELYAPFVRNSDRFIVMDVRSAEMTKYAANAMLATRISFMNEIATICEATNADVNMVRLGIGSDSRIGYSFLYAGCGYGGSCFPKDVQALIKIAQEHNCTAGILQQVEAVNKHQKMVLVDKVIRRFGDDLTGLRFAIWGLAFKPNTDDCREAPAATVISELIKRGASIAAFDPKAEHEFQLLYKGEGKERITYEQSKYSALSGADAMLLITEWKEFRSPDFDEVKARMKTPVIFDGRNQYSGKAMAKMGFEYYHIGVGVG